MNIRVNSISIDKHPRNSKVFVFKNMRSRDTLTYNITISVYTKKNESTLKLKNSLSLCY